MEPPPEKPEPRYKYISAEESKAREQNKWMLQNLSLEPQQYEQASMVNLYYARQCDSIAKVDKKLCSELRPAMKHSKDSAMQSILTPTQYKQYITYKQKQFFRRK